MLYYWENGKPPHPDTITRRFKRLAAAAGLPEIDLHDVRHSYATAGRDAKIDWKALSKRIGHADVVFTMKQYVQADLEADRQVANTLAELIIGGRWPQPRSPTRTRAAAMKPRKSASVSKSVSKPHAEGPFSVREGAFWPW